MSAAYSEPVRGGARSSVWRLLARRIYASALVAFGAGLVGGGGLLAALGGSLYYLIAGVVFIGCGVLIWRRDRRAVWLYGALFSATLAWAIYESGTDVWAMIPRLDAVAVLGVPLLFKRVRDPARSPGGGKTGGWAALGVSVALAVVLGAAANAAFVARRVDPVLRGRPLAAAPARLAQPMAVIANEDWPSVGNDAGSTKFSPMTDINVGNVAELKLAWTADVGPAIKGPPASFEATPLNVGDALYLCNAYDAVVALDAETGQQRWRFTMTRGSGPSGKPCRGVAYVKPPNAVGPCAERILAVSQEGDLFALDMRSGRPCAGFGVDGRVSLREGLGSRPDIFYNVSSAPQIIRGKAVIGGAVIDGQFWGEPSGVIRAYDVVSGKLAWAFDSGRAEGVLPPGHVYTPSSPNSWAPIAADEALGLVYLPMGGSIPDFFGGKRRPGDELIATSTVALDAETGRMRWRFQTVHHDLWDYDVSGQPTLVDLPSRTGVRKALIQVTKTGQIFVLDRQNGQPIFPVREQPAPQLPVAPGERLSRTQPFSVNMPQFYSPRLREADMWGVSPLDQLICRIEFKRSRYDGPFTPTTLSQPTIFEPGPSGGMEWGGVSVDVDRGIAIVNSNRVPQRVRLLPATDKRVRDMPLFNGQGQGELNAPMRNTPYSAIAGPFLSPLGVPCNGPPWGFLTAVDLMTGEVIWNHRFGTGRDSGPLGIPSQMPFRMGVPNQGGSVTTRGGLVFIGAAADDYLRAVETATGRILWRGRLPGGGQASPMVFRSPKSGREFVVIAAGGKPGLGTKLGTKVVAYALPGGAPGQADLR